MRYNYWLVRYVPDTVRGERVNVGVLVGRDGGDWALRRVTSFRRAGRLGGDASLIEPWLEWLERAVADHNTPPLHSFVDPEGEQLTLARVSRLRNRLNNVVQLSQPTPVEGASARSTADFLYEYLVNEYAIAPRSNTRRKLLAKLRHDYETIASLDVGTTLRTRPRAQVGLQRGRFDFAVVDQQVDQLSQVWSFDLSDSEKLEHDVHAWNYLVTRLRDEGGYLGGDEVATLSIASDVSITAVYQDPRGSRDSHQRDVLSAAKEAWRELGVKLVPSSQLDEVAREVAKTSR